MQATPEALYQLITRMIPEQHRLFAGYCAEQVLPIYKAQYPHHRDLWEVLTLLRRGMRILNFSTRLETCWERAFEAEEAGHAHAASAAFIIVNRLELELTQGALIEPVVRISNDSAHTIIQARTSYRPTEPGYAATYITCMQQQRQFAEDLLGINQ